MMKHYDAVIVGGRVAGASTAMLLARRGLRVLIVERSRYGSDTLSTLALMRGGVLQLSRWGVLEGVKNAGTPPIRSTSFFYGDEAVELAIKPKDGVDALYSPRRTVLDALLVDAAVAAGADVWYGVRLVGVVKARDGRVRGAVIEDPARGAVQISAEIVIGADGVRSSVAKLVGAGMEHTGRHSGGVVYGFWSGLDQRTTHWYFAPSAGAGGYFAPSAGAGGYFAPSAGAGGYFAPSAGADGDFVPGVGAGAIPTNDGQTLVFASTSSARFHREIRVDMEAGFHRLLEEGAPFLAGRVKGAERSRSLRGFAGQVGFLRRCQGPGWALVGDAGYFKDPITAHGITDALRDAELLARAVVQGTDGALQTYQSLRDELSLPLFRITDAIASYAWDLETVKKLHVDMSREMNQEVKALAALGQELPKRPEAGLQKRWSSRRANRLPTSA